MRTITWKHRLVTYFFQVHAEVLRLKYQGICNLHQMVLQQINNCLKFYKFRFTFRWIIHIELIFGIWSELWIEAYFFAYEYKMVPAPFIERLSFLYFIPFAPLSKTSWPYVCESISVLFVLFHRFIYLPLHQYTVLITVPL